MSSKQKKQISPAARLSAEMSTKLDKSAKRRSQKLATATATNGSDGTDDKSTSDSDDHAKRRVFNTELNRANWKSASTSSLYVAGGTVSAPDIQELVTALAIVTRRMLYDSIVSPPVLKYPKKAFDIFVDDEKTGEGDGGLRGSARGKEPFVDDYDDDDEDDAYLLQYIEQREKDEGKRSTTTTTTTTTPASLDSDAHLQAHLPSQTKLARFIQNIVNAGEIAPQSCVLYVILLDRLRKRAPFNMYTWRRMVLSSLILGCKVWEDEAVWNSDFQQLFPHITSRTLSAMEKQLLLLIGYRVTMTTAEYTEVFFQLKELLPTSLPDEPLTTVEQRRLEERSAAEEAAAREASKGFSRSVDITSKGRVSTPKQKKFHPIGKIDE